MKEGADFSGVTHYTQVDVQPGGINIQNVENLYQADILKQLGIELEVKRKEEAHVNDQQLSPKENDIPEALATGLAMKYWKALQKAGFVDEHYQLSSTTTRKQAMYIADVFSDKLQMRSKWKPFQDLWHINNLAQEKWDMQETGKQPARSEDIDRIFED